MRVNVGHVGIRPLYLHGYLVANKSDMLLYPGMSVLVLVFVCNEQRTSRSSNFNTGGIASSYLSIAESSLKPGLSLDGWHYGELIFY